MGLISRVSSRTYRVFFKMAAKQPQESNMGQQLDLRNLSPQQLEKVRMQVNQEIQTFTDAIQNYELVMNKFVEARKTLKQVGDQPQQAENQRILVPVTQSMYVPGKLKDANKVLIDIGTGYFVEKTRGDADDFCKRKIELLRQEIEKVAPVLRSRYESKQAVDEVLINMQRSLMARQREAQTKLAK